MDDYPERLKGLKKDHVRVKSNMKGLSGKVERQAKACVYCLIEFKKKAKDQAGNDNESAKTWDKQVKRTEFFCSFCKVYLCKNHFNAFHEDD